MTKTATNTFHALPFLTAGDKPHVSPVCCICGDDPFLRHEVRRKLVHDTYDADEDGLASHTLDGRNIELRDVIDSLSERSLFGSGKRVVVVEEADAFVKSYRENLEAYVENPVRYSLLVLEVKTWLGNTRLAKAVSRHGLTIRCQVPQQGRELTTFIKELKDWLIYLARDQYQIELKRPAVDLLLDLIPTEVGILCQEVAKLSLLVNDKRGIDVALVRDHVGGWRARKTWDMIDAAAEGRAADALNQLDRLLTAGEEPHALLPQMASTFRRFAAAVRVVERGEHDRQNISLRSALEQSGVPPFKLSDAEKQLRQIGRLRAQQLYRWLLAADLELKGHNASGDRARRVLETLIVRLAKDAKPAVATQR